MTLFMVDAISAFSQSYPDITFSLRDTGAEQVEQMVFDGEVDFALASPHKGYEDLSYTPLLEDQHVDGSSLFDGPHDEVSSTTSLFPFLSSGDRYSVVPALAAKAGESFNLQFRALTDPVLSRQICLVTRKLRSLSPTAGRMLNVLLQTIERQELPSGVLLSRRPR